MADVMLSDKLGQFDDNAECAYDAVLKFMQDHRAEIITIGRARHITGHWVHGDKLMFEYSQGRLLKEIAEEIGDAVNYMALWLARQTI